MNTLGQLVLAAILCGVAAGGSGCQPQAKPKAALSKAEAARSKVELQKSGLKLPQAARVLSDFRESAPDGTKFRKWIVASPARPIARELEVEGTDNQSFLDELKRDIPGENIGQSVKPGYRFGTWNNKLGQWTVTTVQTGKGFYFSVENIVLG